MEESKVKTGTIILGLIISFYLGLNWDKELQLTEPIEIEPSEEINFSLLRQTWDLINQDYVEKPDQQKLLYGAVQGMVSALGDPYSLFLNPEDYNQFSQDLEGSFEGIGAEIGIRDNMLTVIAPLSDAPAEQAGLLPGDKVIKINSQISADLTLNQAVTLIRGPRGTPVILTILRNSDFLEITIIRDRIDVPSVKGKILSNRILYLDIDNFYDDVNSELILVLGQFLPFNPRGIVLDLRNNPGGFLERAIDIASWFIDRDQIIVIEEMSNGQRKEHKSRGRGELENLPLVVLVNQGSASASEIVAGALRDLRGITLIGHPTFGKGSVQELKNLSDGSRLRLTTAKWLTPKGHSIHQQGLEPDILVEITIEDIKNKKDPQLDEAIKNLSI